MTETEDDNEWENESVSEYWYMGPARPSKDRWLGFTGPKKVGRLECSINDTLPDPEAAAAEYGAGVQLKEMQRRVPLPGIKYLKR